MRMACATGQEQHDCEAGYIDCIIAAMAKYPETQGVQAVTFQARTANLILVLAHPPR